MEVSFFNFVVNIETSSFPWLLIQNEFFVKMKICVCRHGMASLSAVDPEGTLLSANAKGNSKSLRSPMKTVHPPPAPLYQQDADTDDSDSMYICFFLLG